jgi:uncharacterized protein YqeY
MTLEERLKQDMTAAMKTGNKEVLETIRLLRSQAKNVSIAKGGPLNEEDVLQVLSKEAARRREAMALYEQGGRADLARKEGRELEIIIHYLPKALTADELKTLVAEAVAETGAEGLKDMGKVMKTVMPRVVGRADGKAVQDVVKQYLG